MKKMDREVRTPVCSWQAYAKRERARELRMYAETRSRGRLCVSTVGWEERVDSEGERTLGRDGQVDAARRRLQINCSEQIMNDIFVPHAWYMYISSERMRMHRLYICTTNLLVLVAVTAPNCSCKFRKYPEGVGFKSKWKSGKAAPDSNGNNSSLDFYSKILHHCSHDERICDPWGNVNRTNKKIKKKYRPREEFWPVITKSPECNYYQLIFQFNTRTQRVLRLCYSRCQHYLHI